MSRNEWRNAACAEIMLADSGGWLAQKPSQSNYKSRVTLMSYPVRGTRSAAEKLLVEGVTVPGRPISFYLLRLMNAPKDAARVGWCKHKRTTIVRTIPRVSQPAMREDNCLLRQGLLLQLAGLSPHAD